MTITSRRKKGLPDKKCFDLWVSTGAVRKAANHLAAEGYVNPRNGKAYTPYAVWVAAMRWVIYHMDEARPYYIAEGSTLAEDERLWSEWVIKKAIRLLGDSSVDRFMAWVKDNGLEKYDYAYAEHFGKEPKYTREV